MSKIIKCVLRYAFSSYIIDKVDSKENNSDIGTKRVPKHTFDYLTHNLIDRSLRLNLSYKTHSD